MPTYKRSYGITLIELLVAMSILAILLSIGVPSFSQFGTNNRLTNSSNTLLSSLSLARSEAIKRGNRVVICKSTDGLVCTDDGGWDQGWIVFSDFNNDRTKGGDEEPIIFKESAMPAGYSFSGNANVSNYISFDTQGMTKLISGANQMGTLTLCPPTPTAGGNGRDIILSASGRARIAKITTCS